MKRIKVVRPKLVVMARNGTPRVVLVDPDGQPIDLKDIGTGPYLMTEQTHSLIQLTIHEHDGVTSAVGFHDGVMYHWERTPGWWLDDLERTQDHPPEGDVLVPLLLIAVLVVWSIWMAAQMFAKNL